MGAHKGAKEQKGVRGARRPFLAAIVISAQVCIFLRRSVIQGIEIVKAPHSPRRGCLNRGQCKRSTGSRTGSLGRRTSNPSLLCAQIHPPPGFRACSRQICQLFSLWRRTATRERRSLLDNELLCFLRRSIVA